MPVAFLTAGASLLGGYMQGEATKSAAETSARSQLESARIAAEAAKFRPCWYNYSLRHFKLPV
jgi:hypothetical protein